MILSQTNTQIESKVAVWQCPCLRPSLWPASKLYTHFHFVKRATGVKWDIGISYLTMKAHLTLVIIVCDDSLICVVCGNVMLNVGTRRDPSSITIYHFVEISMVGTENCDIQFLIWHCAEALFIPPCVCSPYKSLCAQWDTWNHRKRGTIRLKKKKKTVLLTKCRPSRSSNWPVAMETRVGMNPVFQYHSNTRITIKLITFLSRR